MAVTPYLFYEDVFRCAGVSVKGVRLSEVRAGYEDARGRIAHASMRLGTDADAMVMMGWPGPKYKSPKRLGHITFNLYVNVSDVDSHCARARKAGATIIEEPNDTPYGARRYGAEDPEGHQWYFATR
jgi:PhnB protein